MVGIVILVLVAVVMAPSATAKQNNSGNWQERRSGMQTQTAIPLLTYSAVDVLGVNDATGIGAGGSHTCVLRTNGTIRCWGYNCSGMLGDGTTTDSNTPVDVVGFP